MFVQFIAVLFFVGIAGLAIGSLMAVKVWYSLPFFLFIIGAFCFGAFWFGVLIGAAFFSWIPIFLTKMIIIGFIIGIIYFFFRHFHPSYGYFPYRGYIHWLLLAAFFFIIGIDFAIIGLSAWLLFILLPIFVGALFFGTVLMMKLKASRTAGAFVIYVPLVLFFFLVIVKLI